MKGWQRAAEATRYEAAEKRSEWSGFRVQKTFVPRSAFSERGLVQDFLGTKILTKQAVAKWRAAMKRD